MDTRTKKYAENPLVKTKIIATVGPASAAREQLRDLVSAGVDLFRLNFAHGQHDWLAGIVQSIRAVSAELGRPIGILGDLSGPKIRLGELPDEGVNCGMGEEFYFVREVDAHGPNRLTSTYEQLLEDVEVNDSILIADGTVSMRVVEKSPNADRLKCVVERGGLIRGRQGINLPGVQLSTPSLTDKDREDLAWAIEHEVDYIGLSFVRAASDILLLREAIRQHKPRYLPRIVAKIEKMEAVSDLEKILEAADAVMVARGDLGVEVDIARVPLLQKRIIRLCNRHRIPVITATQMLDSMQHTAFPTRAEANDVANAVLDGSDAVMLSGETAIGKYPLESVTVMSRIAHEAERLFEPNDNHAAAGDPRTRALVVTEAVTLGAVAAAKQLNADLIVVATHSGRTAMAVSKQRGPVPVLALSDQPDTARRMCLYWGITAVETKAVHKSFEELLAFVIDWGVTRNVLQSGSRIVLVGSTDWTEKGHNMMVVHMMP